LKFFTGSFRFEILILVSVVFEIVLNWARFEKDVLGESCMTSRAGFALIRGDYRLDLQLCHTDSTTMVRRHKADYLNPLTEQQISNRRKKAIFTLLDKSLTGQAEIQRRAEILAGVNAAVEAIRAQERAQAEAAEGVQRAQAQVAQAQAAEAAEAAAAEAVEAAEAAAAEAAVGRRRAAAFDAACRERQYATKNRARTIFLRKI
jgi:hypothetical protein